MTTQIEKEQKTDQLSIDEKTFDKMVQDAISNSDAESLQEFFDIPEEQLEALYDKGLYDYKQGNYEHAEVTFHFLSSLNPYIQKYWMGLGAVRQLQEKYIQALCSFAIATLLDPKDPRPNFHATECYLSLKKPKNAKKELVLAEKKLTHPKGTEVMKQRLLLMKKTINKKNNKKSKGKKL